MLQVEFPKDATNAATVSVLISGVVPTAVTGMALYSTTPVATGGEVTRLVAVNAAWPKPENSQNDDTKEEDNLILLLSSINEWEEKYINT